MMQVTVCYLHLIRANAGPDRDLIFRRLAAVSSFGYHPFL